MNVRLRVSLAIAAVVALAAAVVFVQITRPSPVAVVPTGSVTIPPSAPVTPVPVVTQAPTLRVDGLATVAAPGGLRVWSAPGDPKAKPVKGPLPTGAVVFLTRGPRRANGVDWWEIQSDNRPRASFEFGWVRATAATNQATLLPFAPACPSAEAPVDPGAVKAIGTLQAVACFGRREITVRGQLACYDAAVDSAVGGASWLATNYSCTLDGTFWLSGPVVAGIQGGVRPLVGRYELRGHFDDPEAAGCSWIPFGSSLLTPSGHPDPGAIIVCRQAFVVTTVTKLD